MYRTVKPYFINHIIIKTYEVHQILNIFFFNVLVIEVSNKLNVNSEKNNIVLRSRSGSFEKRK